MKNRVTFFQVPSLNEAIANWFNGFYGSDICRIGENIEEIVDSVKITNTDHKKFCYKWRFVFFGLSIFSV
ncbi:MAG: hypothetical protein LBR59_00450 [Endomicrobium sp.]|nr:hypothetical protein [Endomicrobium sp.]